MRYIMTDWQGRQVGNTETTVDPLLQMAIELKEKNDLVIWTLDANLVRRVKFVVGGDGDSYHLLPIVR